MRTWQPIATLGLVLAGSMRADMHELVKTTSAGGVSLYEVYAKGQLARVEWGLPNSARQEISIQNAETNTFYQLNPPSREYVESQPQTPGMLDTVAAWVARPPRTRQSGKTVDIYFETIDTGERQQFFGHTAKHLLWRERYVAEPGACDLTHVVETDGWYIVDTIPGVRKSPDLLATYLSFGGGGGHICKDNVVRHGSAVAPGLAVRETRFSVTRELIELSGETLDASLFTVPKDYKRVDVLPGYQPVSWSQRMEQQFFQLHQVFASWFY